jgi:hypothetical protein
MEAGDSVSGKQMTAQARFRSVRSRQSSGGGAGQKRSRTWDQVKAQNAKRKEVKSGIIVLQHCKMFDSPDWQQSDYG